MLMTLLIAATMESDYAEYYDGEDYDIEYKEYYDYDYNGQTASEDTFLDENDLAEHESSDVNCGYVCEECGAYYRDEIHLKLHLERHCTQCFDEFSPKNVLEAHKKTCFVLQY